MRQKETKKNPALEHHSSQENTLLFSWKEVQVLRNILVAKFFVSTMANKEDTLAAMDQEQFKVYVEQQLQALRSGQGELKQKL